MRSRSLSLAITVAAALIAGAVAVRMGPDRVSGYSRPDQSQQQDSNQQKRGKNGNPVAPSPKTDSGASPSSADPASPPDNGQDQTPGKTSSGQDKTSGKSSGQSDQAGSSGTTRSSNKDSLNRNSGTSDADPLGSRSGAHSDRSGTEPPPFDRPPIVSRSSRAADSSRGTYQSTTRSDQTPGSSQPDGDRGYSTGGYSTGSGSGSASDTARGRNDRPELRRSPDLGPAPTSGSSDRGRPPVLQRRTDDQGGSDSNQQYPQQQRQSQQGQSPQQAGQQSSGKGDETIKLDATLINLPLLVSDRSGRFIPQLTKRDFDIYEDGVKQEVAFFGNDEVPFNVALMIDVSPSVSNSLGDIQEAAIAFVKELRPEDRIMIVAFDRNVRFLTDFTNDRYVLQRAIDNTRTGNGTSVYEAVYDTVANRLRHVEGRKALILLSDGEDTTSRSVGYEEAINIVTESDVLVYGLRFPDTGGYGPYNPGRNQRNRYPFPLPGSPFPFPFPWPHFVPWDPAAGSGNSGNGGGSGSGGSGSGQWGRHRDSSHGRDFMADVAEAGGGPVYDAKTVRDMPRLARQIADELRHVYVISYYPTNSLSNGGYRSIRVQVKGRDDIAVRHRRGYDATEVRSRPSI